MQMSGATPRSARRRSYAPTKSDPVSGGSGAPSESRPPRSLAGSKKVTGLELEDTLVVTEAPDGNEVLELDELWSFVHRKSEKVWVWLALCQESRQAVAFATGERRAAQLASVYGERSPRATRRRVATVTSGRLTGR